MANHGKASINFIFVLCLAIVCREGKGAGLLDPVALRLRGAARGARDPTEKVFDVKQNGAKADGKHDDAQAFIKTWLAACKTPGKTRVLIPPGNYLLGQTLFHGPCAGPDPIIIEVKGTIKASTDISEYPSEEWISFENINGLVIIGGGTVDGQGASVWKYSDCKVNPDCQRMPVNFMFNRVSNGIVRQISSVNSKGFHYQITNSDNLKFYRLRIIAPAGSPNTDGIHISKSNNIKISKAQIQTGDDCISMIHGSTNIAIQKVTCGPGHGISIGSLGKYPEEQMVQGISVKNCTLEGTNNGIRIKTMAKNAYPNQVSRVFFQDIVMNNVRNPIIIDQAYNAGDQKQDPLSPVKVSDIHYINIRGTTSTPVAVDLVCSKQFPCRGISFKNIDLKFAGPLFGLKAAAASSVCLNTQGLTYAGIQFPPACG